MFLKACAQLWRARDYYVATALESCRWFAATDLLPLICCGVHARGCVARRAEDTAMLPKAGKQSFDGVAKWEGREEDDAAIKYRSLEARWVRIISNDVENIPIGLMVAWGSLLCHFDHRIHIVAVSLFMVARITHTVAFVRSMQPLRSWAFFGGLAAVFAMALNSAVFVLLL